jgi:hypothetical protein
MERRYVGPGNGGYEAKDDDPLRDRLGRALPDYEIQRRVAVGGMGIVFRGRDRALDMPVAIKVLRPELATAVAAERFMREARLLAAVNHPSVVTIHKVGEADGLFYFVMEWLDHTLADRLRRGPLAPAEVVRMGRELLDGLARVHAHEIVHRDIKPSNIFIMEDGRAKVGDFGIARRDRSVEPPITETRSPAGTPAYMAPEQFVSGDVSAAADLYATGMVCYEALTGRRWRSRLEPRDGDWTGVPHRVREVLVRALAIDPAERWPTAGALAGGLAAAQRPARGWWAAAGAATLLTAVIVLIRSWIPPPPVTSDIAVLPFVEQGGSRDLGERLAISVAANLTYAFGDSGLRVTPTALTRPWTAQRGDVLGELPAGAWRDLRTERVLRGRLVPRGDSTTVQAELLHRDGHTLPLAGVAGPSDPGILGHRLAFAVVRALRPDLTTVYAGLPGGEGNAAVAAMVAAEHAFQRDNWAAAEAFYQRAIALDSSLALAQWGLYNVRRWRRATTTADVAALRDLYARYADAFLGLDRLLIEADLAPTVPERIAIYRSGIALYPYDPYPRLLLGNELFHRGALAGLGLDSAIAALEDAAAANPYVASTYSMLAWAFTRRGDEERADSALAAHARIGRAQPEEDFWMQGVLKLAAAERFLPPARADRERAEVLTSPGGVSSLARAVRLGLAFGIPRAQYLIGGELATLPDVGARIVGLTAQALALLAEGRVAAALERLDEAARVTGDPELAFQAAQWRVLLPALGVPGVLETERAAGRARIEQDGDSARAARAHWTLLLDALARGTPDAEAHRRGLDAVQRGDGLRALGEAFVLAAGGDTARAIAMTDSLRDHVLAGTVQDPLQRAVLFLRLGEWLAGRQPRAADAAWRWYENADLAGWPEGYPQAAELDWALETFARYQRARLARESGAPTDACPVMSDAAQRWAGADPSYRPLRDDLSAWMTACTRS